MSIPKCLDFEDYDNYPADENPTTDAQMQEFMGNQNNLAKELAYMLWQPNTNLEVGRVIRSSAMPVGLQAVVTAGGTSGMSEPEWTELGTYVGDSGVIYKMVNIVTVASDILPSVYPIGSVYISALETNPTVIFGFGTWERIGEGRCIIDSGEEYMLGSVGGAYIKEGNVGNTTLSISQIPAHQHANTVKITNAGAQAGSHKHTWYSGQYGSSSTSTSADAAGKGANDYSHDTTSTNPSSHTHNNTVSITNANAGGGGSHNHSYSINVMQPYIAMCVWKRIA